MELKFITLNMWHGHLLQAALEFLQTEDADVVVLQEVSNATHPKLSSEHRMLEVLRENLPYPHVDFAPALINIQPEGGILQGNAIFSKFPITSSQITFFNEPFSSHYIDDPKNYPTCPRNPQHITVDTPAGQLNVLNLQGVWDLDGDNYSPQRQNMSRVILEAIKGRSKVIVAGDTNARPTNQAIRNITAHLTDVFAGELTSTFNMRRKTNPGYADSIVDFILVSPDIKIGAHTCPDIDVSDHLPLIANFRIAT